MGSICLSISTDMPCAAAARLLGGLSTGVTVVCVTVRPPEVGILNFFSICFGCFFQQSFPSLLAAVCGTTAGGSDFLTESQLPISLKCLQTNIHY